MENDKNILTHTKIDGMKRYKINQKHIKTLKALYKSAIDEPNKDFLKERTIYQLKDLIDYKVMSYMNVFLVINSVQETIEYYSHSSKNIDENLLQDIKALYAYMSKYYIVYRNDLDYICFEKKTNRTFAFDFSVEVHNVKNIYRR